ncbi:hypothetical protein [Nocardioides sp.]|uniref:hypothetical protein n=1 Tax=Nocardioides sp. TaxID=35761 RepID=UPI0025E73D1E|nr:hypothetical protein [Nocardioides sp.]
MSITNVTIQPAAAPALTPQERERLALLADRLIAGGAGLPSASGAEVHTQWIDRAMAVRADLDGAVRAVLALEGDPAEVVERLQAEDPVLFGSFAMAVAGAYLINPRIRRELGYPGPAPMKNAALPDEAESYLEDGILDVVVARGPIYRPTPAS